MKKPIRSILRLISLGGLFLILAAPFVHSQDENSGLDEAIQAANIAPEAAPYTRGDNPQKLASPTVLAAEQDSTVMAAILQLWKNGHRNLRITQAALSGSCGVAGCDTTSLVIFHLTTPHVNPRSASVIALVKGKALGKNHTVKLVDRSQF